MNDQTAQMGFQVGKTAMAAGQEYMEHNVPSPFSFHVPAKLFPSPQFLLLTCSKTFTRSTATSPYPP